MEKRRLWLKSGLEFFKDHSSPSSDNKSFEPFKKEGCGSPTSSWNSKSESDKCHSLLGEENYMKQNRADNGNGLLWEKDNTSYDEKIMNLHVTHLEEEIIKLKDQVEKSENQVDDLSEELKLKEEELHNLKEFSDKEIFKLKAQIEERPTWLKSIVEYFNIHSSWNSKSERYKCLGLFAFLLVLIPGFIPLVPETLFILIVVYIISAFQKKGKGPSLLKEENCFDTKQNGAYKTSYDEEIMNLHVTHLEEEIIKLKDQVEKGENQFDDLSEELELKEEELHNLKEFSDKEIYKLKAQIVESEAKKQVQDISNLVEQLEIANEKLKISEEENAVLRKELESKSCENHQLQGKLIEAEENIAQSDLELVSGRKHIQVLDNLVMIYEQHVQILKSKMVNSQNKFSLEKEELHFDIAGLLKTKIELTSTLADCEFRNNELEGKLRQYEAEQLKQEELHATTQKEFGWRLQDIEAISKELYMVMMERDEANVTIDRLENEICTLKFQMWNMNK